jgi:raffinose/stachyose/melibiose transport system permease protein
MGLDRYTRSTLLREIALILVAAVYCLPFYLMIALSLETDEQTYRAPLSLPWPPQFGNFSEAWGAGGQGGLRPALLSSLTITVTSVVGLIVLGSLCAYTIARRPGLFGNVVFAAVVVGIILPFQLALIPLFIAMLHLGLVGNYLGIIVLNIGLLMPLTIFLYTGFIRTLPRDYEESARVDGAGILRIYARIVFPLLRPVTATVAVLIGITIWNEFFVAVIFLNGSSHETIPVALYSFAGEGATRPNLLFAGIAITIAPILIFYLFAQRHLIRGFTAGVKG